VKEPLTSVKVEVAYRDDAPQLLRHIVVLLGYGVSGITQFDFYFSFECRIRMLNSACANSEQKTCPLEAHGSSLRYSFPPLLAFV
jgi:hypothetical protein